MRKLILKMSMSLDGFVCGPNGEIDWIFKTINDEGAAWTVKTISEAGLHIMGSRTFRDMIAYWPTSKEVFAAPMNEIPKAVFTRKGDIDPRDQGETTTALKDATSFHGERLAKSDKSLSPHANSWQEAYVAKGDMAEELKKMKAQPGKRIVAHGGASFAQSLVATGLVDEYHLVVHPVVLGKGLSPFAALSAPRYLKLVEIIPFKGGAAAHVYRA
ncbi:MAG: dihydrofolate reductase family protein [Bacteroidetes bacterium]|nr:dihydrofolate reductase family protein [Bacteroidota bacterium]